MLAALLRHELTAARRGRTRGAPSSAWNSTRGGTRASWTSSAPTPGPNRPPADPRRGRYSTPLDEPADNLAKVGWYTAPDKFRLLYAGEVAALMAAVGAQKPNGVASFDDITLKKAADWLAAATPAATFAVDFEPADPAQDAWMWDYEHPNFRAAMRKLSDYLYESHGRRFYSWIDPGGQTFDHHGVKLVLNGYATGRPARRPSARSPTPAR